MRALVIGGDSLIGKALAAELKTRGHAVIRSSRRREGLIEPGVLPLDLADPSIGNVSLPATDVAFFCAAITGFADCREDTSRSQRVNVTSPTAIASRLVVQGARVILLSTSAVFDCREPTMSADRPYAPRGVYGSQKAEAELQFLALGALASVLRLTKVLAPGRGLLSEWKDALSHSRAVRAFADVRISPLKVQNVTDALVAIANQGNAGVYQVSGAGDVSYAEIGYHLAKQLRVSQDLVERRSAIDAGIPPDEVTPYTSLDSSRLAKLIGFRPPAPFAVIDEILGGRTDSRSATVLNSPRAR